MVLQEGMGADALCHPESNTTPYTVANTAVYNALLVMQAAGVHRICGAHTGCAPIHKRAAAGTLEESGAGAGGHGGCAGGY